MKNSIKILFVAAAAVLMASCNKEPQYPAQPDWSKFPDPSEKPDDGLLKPAPCAYNVVAHRGGSSEANLPDNSIASLKYAKDLGCYASECDIYWTKDNNVIVAHADGQCKVNGLHPWEATVDEIRAKGTLSNGEQIPTLAEFIDIVCVEGSCTRLWPDIKNITSPSTLTQYPINATKRACEIIVEKGAQHFVEFICTGNTTVMKSAYAYATNNGIAIGWMSNQSAIAYAQNGYPWANLSAASYMCPEAGGEGARTLEEFQKLGIELSVYNVDKKAGDGNAVYSEKAIKYYMDNYKSFKALCTNYPKWLIETIAEATKTYDGISNEEELLAFAADVAKDPEAKRFQNKDGEVVIHKDITVAKAWTPIDGFNGVLNGNGKKIVFNSSTAGTKIGMFSVLKGVVKNLEVAGKFESTNTDSEIQIGAIAAEICGGQISGCTSSASISVQAKEAAKHLVIMGGVAAKISEGAYIVNTKYTGDLSLNSETAYFNIGGIVGVSAQDDQLITLKNCSFEGKISIESNNQNTDWSYMGGIFGKPQTKTLYTLPNHHAVFDGCKVGGTIDVKAASKLRFGGVVGYIKACTKVENCEVSAKMTMNCKAAYDRACGGVIGFQETSSDSYVKACTFSGSLVSGTGSLGNNYFGGITTTGMSKATIIEGCKTTKTAVVDITGANGKSVGMIGGRPNTAGVTIKDCKIAGKLVKADGTATVITASNIEDWMFIGSATTAAITLSGNGYNAE